jgi:hypothetical protein
MESTGSCFSETLAEPQEVRGWRALDSLRFIAASKPSFFATARRLNRLTGQIKVPMFGEGLSPDSGLLIGNPAQVR